MPLVRDNFLSGAFVAELDAKFVTNDLKADNQSGEEISNQYDEQPSQKTIRKITMQDTFITTQTALLNNWLEAFPTANLAAAIDENSFLQKSLSINSQVKNVPTLFWLHMNMDRQQWLTNSIAYITKNYTDAKIIVLANAPNQAEALHALSLGAMGYCHAYIAPAILKEIKTVIISGGLWLGQELLQRLIEVSTNLVGNQPDYVESLLLKLTKREKDVAVEAAKGLSNKEIARILNITDRTVKAHLAAIFERLGAKDRLQLALMLNSNYRR